MINNTITIHDNQAFESMRKSGKLAAEILDFITPHIVPGITTERIDKLCYDYHIANNAIPGPLGYRGFPKSICTSINHVVCHGIPGDRILKDGDIINIDVSPILDGWYGDTSRMFFVGNVKIKGQRLVNITYEAMFEGIKAVRPGATLGDIGYSIQNFVENQGFSVVRDFCGHGIGQTFHCPPNVMHYGNKGEGLVLKEGMIFTIEPMVNSGKYQTKILDDGWTAVTKDRSLSAQFEHTIGVTPKGFEIFTLSPKGYTQPPYEI
ncbi:MAG: type I methionyl aminopeptidase [Alphaproteobacteria bacterium TMED87]|nr:type I methionyl aminopeptidase [Rhodospirillaceae bacterium]OUV11361.1 MAG: type I methionyl aminopeptidase [Alphaproteobacteria bacterium TMED87]|tara:strand:+ start:665 stop:1456 length:792 start_codon:yes stop_codon:yes gene_type:complete